MTIQYVHESRKVMRTPRSVDIDITNSCNLRCLYCYHFGSASDVGMDLPSNEWIKFMEELGSLSVMDVTLAGGEPFIRDDIFEIIQGIVDNRMRFSVLSNGTLISEKVAEGIAATKRCNVVQVSLDGANATTHDSCRGPNSFYRTIEGIRHLQKYGVPVAIRLTIHRKNVHELEKIVSFVLDDLGIATLSTNSTGYFGLCKNHSTDIQLTIEDRCLAMRSLVYLSRLYPGRITAMAGPLADAKMYLQIEQAIKNNQAGIKGRGFLTGCGCTWVKLTVRADGIIIPCNLLPTIELGQINHDSFLNIWQNHTILREMRKRYDIPLASFSFCKGCRFIPYCTGNCPAEAYANFGEVCHPSPEGCYREFLAKGGTLSGCGRDNL